MKFAILFPGQGSQQVGMGLDLVNTIIAKDIFLKVNKICNRNATDIFLYGPQEELNQTQNTQVSIVTISVILTLLLQENLKENKTEFNPFACCGHSLGEFTALWYANIIDFETLINIVSRRGKLMQQALPGSMVAVLNVSQEKILDLTMQKEFKGNIVIANYNTPNQFVLSGKKECFQLLIEKIKLMGGKAIILPVGGAFHSPLMEAPSKTFDLELDKVFENVKSDGLFPIYQNHDGRGSKDYKTIIQKIKKQMTSPVLWTQTINNLVNDGVKDVIEIGPGRILTGLVKKINQSLDCYNIYDLASLNEFIEGYERKLP